MTCLPAELPCSLDAFGSQRPIPLRVLQFCSNTCPAASPLATTQGHLHYSGAAHSEEKVNSPPASFTALLPRFGSQRPILLHTTTLPTHCTLYHSNLLLLCPSCNSGRVLLLRSRPCQSEEQVIDLPACRTSYSLDPRFSIHIFHSSLPLCPTPLPCATASPNSDRLLQPRYKP